ncbi:branched-chain amino acid transaminase [Methanobrevibacter curvatus]|uniref:Branched-chain-amino-acid aminotransferase n=1 Tax=Methanobrevibacter curvatus TaxID=49547 RepID=A0A166AA91_9EURY|nr:branched-chain amino acid transaminase [Methanobrevibacter curvatus]KZX11779.1 branched-chain-amino-acid aminotransferase [Methanobrevibacter curvatus]
MTWDENGKIWMNGELVDWKDANIHVLSHVVHYGSSVFEGIRSYEIDGKGHVFRLEEHIQRLFDSGKIYRIDIPYSKKELIKATKDTIKENNLTECYIRPIVYRGYGVAGVDPTGSPIDVAIAVWKWGKYLGEEGISKGVDIGVSTWRRMAPNTLPSLAKAGANYMNAQLAKLEAVENGYNECIMLDTQGFIGEGSGENLFMIKDETIYTPPLSSSILKGLTRDAIIKIAKNLNYEVVEDKIPRESIYIADELFFTGTAAEVTPIRSVDKIQVGSGTRGPITEKIQNEFFKIVEGKSKDKYGWLSPVEE